MDSTSVPPFFDSAELESSGSYSGVFKHDGSIAKGEAHVRWWPCEGPSSQPRTIISFIPGNPGLIDFYIPFLSALHQIFKGDELAIFAHAHLGHTPHLNNETSLGLLHQVDAAVETFDAIQKCWPDARIILIGHSVGSWISTQVLKERPDAVNGLFLLFPTISHISQTPNGKRLSWLFKAPMVSIISRLSILIRPIVAPVLSVLFSSWPAHQKAVLHSLICSRRSINACLTMAREEMRTLKDLDVPLLKRHSSKLWFYYADDDDWVGSERENVVQSLGSGVPAIRMVHCKHGIPHAFCILHGDFIAAQCAAWLREGGFIGGK